MQALTGVAEHQKWRRSVKILATVVDTTVTCDDVRFFVSCSEIKLVLYDLYLTRFDLTKDLSFDTLVIAVFNQ